VDKHGALRHRLPELCGVGAVALLLFAHFHILGHPVPDFAPDFEAPECGQYGVRSWYQYHLFWPTRKPPTSSMTYESECVKLNHMCAMPDGSPSLQTIANEWSTFTLRLESPSQSPRMPLALFQHRLPAFTVPALMARKRWEDGVMGVARSALVMTTPCLLMLCSALPCSMHADPRATACLGMFSVSL
jgi:hypothetical protein